MDGLECGLLHPEIEVTIQLIGSLSFEFYIIMESTFGISVGIDGFALVLTVVAASASSREPYSRWYRWLGIQYCACHPIIHPLPCPFSPSGREISIFGSSKGIQGLP